MTTSIRTNCFPSPATTTRRPDLGELMRPDPKPFFNQACKVLKDHFSELAGFSIFGSGTIDMNELYKAQMSSNPDVAAAARFIMSQPEMLRELETQGGSSPDGKISLGDLKSEITQLDRGQAVQQLRYDPRLSRFTASVDALARYAQTFDTAGGGFFGQLGGPDGKISRDDLKAVLSRSDLPLEVQDAATFLLNNQNQDLLGLLDTGAKGGNPDGTISFQDISVLLGQLRSVQPTMPPVWNPYIGA
jgi:hypothetical protein